MQTNLLVGPIPTTLDISTTTASVVASSVTTGSFGSSIGPTGSRRRSFKIRSPAIFAAASSAVGGDQDHYAMLGVARNATSADIKRAYRLLARKHHPDVSKHSKAEELFKNIRLAYDILSNESTRSQYDQALRFGERHPIYCWSELRRNMQQEKYQKQYRTANSFYYDQAEEVGKKGSKGQERDPAIKVLRLAFISLLLLKTFGARFSLAFSSLMAMLDHKLDAGYKMGYLIAWVLGDKGGILLTLCLQFASWVCGKTSSSMVALVLVAVWVGANLSQFAPLPQGALLTLLYMSVKLQADQT